MYLYNFEFLQMTFYNISNPSETASLKNAVLKSISSESGLFMPTNIPVLPKAFFDRLPSLSLPEIGFEVAKAMLGDDISDADLRQIVDQALSFDIPLKKLDEQTHVLELFHGPTLAFKDVGARFMAGLFEYFLQNDNKEVTILVATSGDTGSAVANAFYDKKGVKVVILYPSGKVSNLQEKQLTTMGGNITAIELQGNFDDCQKMVKQAFGDAELNQHLILTSANSINFARLFPQSFYYFYALAQLGKTDKPIVVSVPSGNFGNLTAGLIAKRMGLPIHTFIAATNSNHSVPDYLKTGTFTPAETHYTISNAMDVGNPNNFPRMLELYGKSHTSISKDIKGHWCSEAQSHEAMKELQSQYGYQADPHGAIAYSGLKGVGISEAHHGIFLETAHPAKFADAVEAATGKAVEIPKALAGILDLEKKSIRIKPEFEQLKEVLI